MASQEKVKHKRGKSGSKRAKKSADSDGVTPIENPRRISATVGPPTGVTGGSTDSQPGSVISVREATRKDKADTLKNGDRSRESASASRPSSARPVSASSIAGELRPLSSASNSSTLQAVSPRPDSAATLTPLDGSRPNTAASNKSYRKNKSVIIEPEAARPSSSLQRSQSNLGSMVSVRSKEAWADGGTHYWPGEETASLNGYNMSPDELNMSKSTSALFGPPDLNLAHAYIPYLYARDCIAKIVEDMKKMKRGHISIVNGIEANYRSIEDDTQAQFNTFVINLQGQYGHKVKTFRQVVEVHRIELQNKQQYWDEALASMSGKNKKLLEDKKMLLIQNKVEFERLEKEKADAISDLTHKLDEKDRIIIDIQRQLDELRNRPKPELQSRPVSARTLLEDPPPFTRQPTVIVTDLSDEERRRMEEERQRMAEERQKMREEREDWEKERDQIVEERRKFQEERVVLQGDLNAANKDKEMWQAKYEELKAQMEELEDLRNKYNALQDQLAALAAVAQPDEEKVQEAEQDVLVVEEEKKTLEDDLKAWHDDFKEQHDREPTEEEKPDSTKEMEASLEEAKDRIDQLNAQLETMEKLRAGEVPQPPGVEMQTVVVKQPEIRIVEIKVPDPEVVAALEMTQEELEVMRKQLMAMKVERSRLQDANHRLEGEVGELTRAVTNLEAIKEELERQLAEALKRPGRIKELERDLKKTVKMLTRQQKNEPDPDVEELETKIAELESELIDQKGLQDNVADLERRLAEALALVAALKEHEKELEGELRDQKEKHDQKLREKELEHEKKVEELKKEHEKLIKEKEEEKREMEKDIKKLLKHIDKLRKKLAVLEGKEEPETDDLEDIVSELEDRVSDLEADKEHLTSDNKDLEDKLEKLERDLAEAKDKLLAQPTPMNMDDFDDLRKRIKELEDQLQKKEQELEEAEKQHKAEMREKEKFIKEMEGDMKKLLRRIDKLQKRLAAIDANKPKEDDDSEQKRLEQEVEKLEEKVADLENRLDAANLEKEEQDEKIAELTTALALSAANDGENALLQKQADRAEAELREEHSDHEIIREELQAMKHQLLAMKTEAENQKQEAKAKLEATAMMKDKQIDSLEKRADALEAQVARLDQERLKDVPTDTAREIKELKEKLSGARKEHDALDMQNAALAAQIRQLKAKINSLEKTNKVQKSGTSDAEQKLKTIKAEHSRQMKQLQAQLERRFSETLEKQKRKIEALEHSIKEMGVVAASRPSAGKGAAPGGGTDLKQVQELKEKLRDTKRDNSVLKAMIRQLETDAKRGILASAGGGGGSLEPDRNTKKQEKTNKDLEKRLENEKMKNKKNEENLKKKDEELAAAHQDNKEKGAEIDKLKAELAALALAAREAKELGDKVKKLEKETKKLMDENKALAENFNSERVLRKKYYNMVEDMKGKIRVYCRVRPMSKAELARGNTTICKSPDEFTINVETPRGPKEFQFDTVFMEDSSQDKVFEDTHNLVQSAVDGYNVCIFAYGQTGSGKTYTIIGDESHSHPGIAPRAFTRIFDLLEENRQKFKYRVSCYMLELYNDRLLDLFSKPGTEHDEKLEIKKDKKGMVYVSGSEVKDARNAKELFALFEQGSKTRHTASTKMNATSSRSHLVIGIVIETTNKSSGQVLKGKLSLVDLAGSERAAKTDSGPEQLREAMSINKSLSALGDVISALSSEQSFIPYRNNKLTMLMQDSLGGNAKTLMFVNISPADYNTEESVVSLTYASRVKLITNDAQKNAENKEIARLKAVIMKMRKGGHLPEHDVDEG